MNLTKPLVRDVDFFWEAVNVAYSGQHRVRVGCVAAVNCKLICGGFNTYRNDPKFSEWGNATYHAERNTVLLIPQRFIPKSTLYIARLNLNGEPCPSRPCRVCLQELKAWGIRELVYMNDIKRIVKEKL
jgi:deoxycytidylate deaminase